MTDKVFDIPKDTEGVTLIKEAPKKQKLTKVKKVIDDTTRESLVEKLKQSRKIKDYEKETAELKNKIIELEKSKEEKVIEDKPKRVQTPKIKVIDEPVEPMKEPSPIIKESKVQEIKLAVPEKYIYSTFTRPLWK